MTGILVYFTIYSALALTVVSAVKPSGVSFIKLLAPELFFFKF